jgi:hypothetical protein
LASNQTAIQHVFQVVILRTCEFIFAIKLYKRNDSHLDMSDL